MPAHPDHHEPDGPDRRSIVPTLAAIVGLVILVIVLHLTGVIGG